jgi:anti-sigma B factor antagonist
METGDGRFPLDGHLSITTESVRGGVRVVPRGELDLQSANALEDVLREVEPAHDLVVLDLRELSFMDSTGLHVLIAADVRMRERGGDLMVVRDDSQVGKLLDLTQVTERLHVVSEPRHSFSS